MSEKLYFELLKQTVTGHAAAIRLRQRLEPAGGPGGKVFPPTHSGGVYAWEKRRINGEEAVTTVLLDSVQSQANRMEQALLEAWRDKALPFPLLAVDFGQRFPDIGEVTALDAPHRIADAIFRDSLYEGQRFRESAIGQAFAQANIRNATALFLYCPHALVFGVWDSTGSAGGLGNKFQRAVVSEIIGVEAAAGVVTSSRIDPMGIKAISVYKKQGVEDWTSIEAEGERDKDGNLILFKKKKNHKGVASEINHSNIPPDFKRFDPEDRKSLTTAFGDIKPGEVLPGGVTLGYALQTWVLSLPALRRLRFPVDGEETTERTDAARTVLAAMALAAITHLREQGYDLRSRCLLIPEGQADFELIGHNGRATPFELTAQQADALFAEAVKQAATLGLRWNAEKISLVPEDRLVELVRRSRASDAPEA